MVGWALRLLLLKLEEDTEWPQALSATMSTELKEEMSRSSLRGRRNMAKGVECVKKQCDAGQKYEQSSKATPGEMHDCRMHERKRHEREMHKSSWCKLIFLIECLRSNHFFISETQGLVLVIEVTTHVNITSYLMITGDTRVINRWTGQKN